VKVFISGSISIKKLPTAAITKIDNIIKKNFTIIIGDAKGADACVQKYLVKKQYGNVIVYFAGNKIRNNIGKWNVIAVACNCTERGKKLYTLKDIEMAKEADYGLMIWDGKSEGTLNNISMMKSYEKKFFVVIEEMIVADSHVDAIIEINNRQLTVERSQVDLF